MPPQPHHRQEPGSGAPARRTVLVLAGGGATHPALALPPADLVVAADSGARLAPALGVSVDVVVGDLDSLGEAGVAALEAGGTRVERHHPDKDATDLELALAAAVAGDPARIVLVGGHGGRLDHALANLGALAAVAGPGRRVEAWMGEAHVAVTTTEVDVRARAAETVSLVPVNGAVTGVTTTGLRWPLVDATLAAGTTWGVSNQMTGPRARVAVGSGALAVIRPHALDPAADRPPVPERPDPGPARPRRWGTTP